MAFEKALREQAEKEDSKRYSVNDLLDEEFDDEQALWDEEAERREKEKREQELYDMPRSESFFEGRSDEDVQKLINEASDSLSFIIRQSAESTAEKAIRGYKQYSLSESAMRDTEAITNTARGFSASFKTKKHFQIRRCFLSKVA